MRGHLSCYIHLAADNQILYARGVEESRLDGGRKHMDRHVAWQNWCHHTCIVTKEINMF